jgi:RimJ/RimL family protein N-acetyltransferase
LDVDDRRWTYLPYGPFANLEEYYAWVDDVAHRDDPMFFAIINSSGKAAGVASYQHVEPLNGSIEVGHISFSSLLQATTAATEAMYLMMRNAFDELGYRRYEWKCDALNQPSRLAAERLGFSYEGTFRQMRVVKGRNRDTAWYSITDRDWLLVKPAFEQWLVPSNFDVQGRQRLRLSRLTKAALLGRRPD